MSYADAICALRALHERVSKTIADQRGELILAYWPHPDRHYPTKDAAKMGLSEGTAYWSDRPPFIHFQVSNRVHVEWNPNGVIKPMPSDIFVRPEDVMSGTDFFLCVGLVEIDACIKSINPDRSQRLRRRVEEAWALYGLA